MKSLASLEQAEESNKRDYKYIYQVRVYVTAVSCHSLRGINIIVRRHIAWLNADTRY